MATPQKENGFTPIANEILEHLSFAGINGSEYRVILFVLRKTYGFQKKKDRISLTQFQKGTGMNRAHAVRIIKSLVDKRILVKEKGVYLFNKNWEDWVVHKRVPSTQLDTIASTQKDTKSSTQKDTYKRKKETITKETTQSVGTLGSEVIYSFKELNPSYGSLFKRKSQHLAAERLIQIHGLERIRKVIEFVTLRRSDRYCPTITSPTQLEDKWAALEKYAVGLKANVKNQNVIW